MSELVRFGVAMDEHLLRRFDEIVERKGYANRSEALRDLVRAEVDREAWRSGKPTVATITLVYDHHVRELTQRLTAIQHELGSLILSTLHIHLDHDHCLEVIAARGPSRRLAALAERLSNAKGVVSSQVAASALPRARAKH